jgi:hypothetical protein
MKTFFSTGSVAMEMSSHIKGDESKDEQPSTADNYLGNYTGKTKGNIPLIPR